MTKLFKPMRSCAPEEAHPTTFPKLASLKLDGIRVCKPNGKTCTKSGKPLPNLHIRKFIEDHVPDGFDMEVISGDPFAPDCYKKTYSAAMTIEGTPDFTLYVFDMCNNLTDYALTRLETVRALHLKASPEAQANIVIVGQTMITSQEQLDEFYATAIALGAEGVILKDPLGLYLYGKSTPKRQTQLKLKQDEDAECVILSVFEGQTNENAAFKNEVGETKRSTHKENKVGNGRAGGFVCKMVEDTSDLTFRVAPGNFTHGELKAIWEQELKTPGHLTGRFLKYRSLGYGVDKRPRHARALGFRAVEDMEPCTSS